MFIFKVFFITVAVVLAQDEVLYNYGVEYGPYGNVFGSSKSSGNPVERLSSAGKKYDHLQNENVADTISSNSDNGNTVKNYEDVFVMQNNAYIRSPVPDINKSNVNIDQNQGHYENVLKNAARMQQDQVNMEEFNFNYNKHTPKQSNPVSSILYPHATHNVKFMSTTDDTIVGSEPYQIRDNNRGYENQKRLGENNINMSMPSKEPGFLNSLTRIDDFSEDKLGDSNSATHEEGNLEFYESSRDKASQLRNEQDYLHRKFYSSDSVSRGNEPGLQPKHRNDLKEMQLINTLTRIDSYDYVTDRNVDARSNNTENKQTVFRNKLINEEIGDQNKKSQGVNLKQYTFNSYDESSTKNYPKTIMRDTDRTYLSLEVKPLIEYYKDSNVKDVTKETPGAAPLASLAAGCIPGKVRVFEVCVPKD